MNPSLTPDLPLSPKEGSPSPEELSLSQSLLSKRSYAVFGRRGKNHFPDCMYGCWQMKYFPE